MENQILSLIESKNFSHLKQLLSELNPADIALILEILKKHGIKVTFFMIVWWVENFPGDVKAIYEAGHDLGNHSENHNNCQ